MFSTQIVAEAVNNRSKSSDKLSRNTFWAHPEHRQLPETISSFTLWLRWILNVLRNEQSSSGGNSKQTDVSVSTTVVNVQWCRDTWVWRKIKIQFIRALSLNHFNSSFDCQTEQIYDLKPSSELFCVIFKLFRQKQIMEFKTTKMFYIKCGATRMDLKSLRERKFSPTNTKRMHSPAVKDGNNDPFKWNLPNTDEFDSS